MLIKELGPAAGSVVVDGKVAYASQEPWIFSGTLRENVLFGLPYKHEWYQKVIEACSLDKVGGLRLWLGRNVCDMVTVIWIGRTSSSLLMVT